MFRAILLLLLLAGSIILGIQLQKDPGYILIAINKTSIETTLWVATFILIIGFFLFYALIQIVTGLARSPKHLRQWRKKRKMAAARRMTRKGLIQFSEGYWADAKKNLIKALPQSDTPLINYLISARAAQEMGDYTLRDQYLREAQQFMPEAKIAVELTQAQLQLANKQWEQALATLCHLQDLAPKHPYVLKLLAKLYEAVKDWPHLIELLPTLRHHHILTNDQYQTLLQQSYIQQLKSLMTHRSYDEVIDFYNTIPKSLRSNPVFVCEIAKFYAQNNQLIAAKHVVKKALSKHLSDDLVLLFSQLDPDESDLKFTESLLHKHPHSATLLLCNGKICKHLELWGKSKKYLQQSIDTSPSKEGYWVLGCLLERLHQQEEALELFKKGYTLIQ